MHNQPDVPLLEGIEDKREQWHTVEGPLQPPNPPTPSVDPGKDESCVEDMVLKMVGWKEVTALGIDGNGRVESV